MRTRLYSPLQTTVYSLLLALLLAGAAVGQPPNEPQSQPNEPVESLALEANKAGSICKSGLTATKSGLHYPKPGTGSCEATVIKAEGELSSYHYRSACRRPNSCPSPAPPVLLFG